MKSREITDEKRQTLMLGYLCVATEIGSSIERKVQILDRFALKDAEIAIICNCAPQSVLNARQKNKKKK